MKVSGRYKIRYQRASRAHPSESADPIGALLGQIAQAEHRTQRILDSLSSQFHEGGGASKLRVRRVFSSPREIFRVELDRPDLGYMRTTLLGRDALEMLLESDDAIRGAVEAAAS